MEDVHRYHYAREPVALDPARDYYTLMEARGDKPNGLWYSVEEDWLRWCTDNEYESDRLEVRHTLDVDLTRIKVIRTIEELDAFSDEHGVPYVFYNSRIDSVPVIYTIRWAVVAAQYAGVEIAPYLWERRLDGRTRWYYTWDCASGCVWDLSAVKRFE